MSGNVHNQYLTDTQVVTFPVWILLVFFSKSNKPIPSYNHNVQKTQLIELIALDTIQLRVRWRTG